MDNYETTAAIITLVLRDHQAQEAARLVERGKFYKVKSDREKAIVGCSRVLNQSLRISAA
jgi:hypothetical protein